MNPSDIQIKDVSDTSLWVAYYRAKETQRPDALFHDPLAQVLIGERGKKIAENMKQISPYVEFAVVARTVIIDQFIQNAVHEGVDTVINLGTGLDTRPYRMMLPNSLKWVEVDYPHIIDLKNNLLKNEKPTCQLERIALDLADAQQRQNFFREMGSQTKKALIITEGVIPYLSEEHVRDLGVELHQQSTFKYWIAEYINPVSYKYLKTGLRTRKMQNAPFQFYPKDWLGFFKALGWVPKEIQYHSDIALKHNRKPPMPWWAQFLWLFFKESMHKKVRKFSGYVIFQRE